MENYLIFLGVLAAYFLIQFLFSKLFYNGRLDKNKWQVFNLSIYAEIGLTILYLFFGIYSIIELIINLPKWYEWILPILWSIIFLIKGLTIFHNRNNYLMFKNRDLKYKITNEEGNFSIDSYKFLKKKSDAVSLSSEGWFLNLKGSESKKNEIEFDLKNYNLEGFKNGIEKYFNTIDLPKH